jgi:hypothetical protein
MATNSDSNVLIGFPESLPAQEVDPYKNLVRNKISKGKYRS